LKAKTEERGSVVDELKGREFELSRENENLIKVLEAVKEKERYTKICCFVSPSLFKSFA
jgi:hypothetical protein